MKIDHTHTEQVLRWLWTLNNWDWPYDLPGKPKDWDSLPWYTKNPNDRTRHELISEIKDRVINLIPEKEQLRYHHKYHLSHVTYNDLGFELWYLMHFGNIEPTIMIFIENWLERHYYNERHY